MRLSRIITANEVPALGIVEGNEVVDLGGTELPAEPAAALAEVGRDGLEKLAAGAPRRPIADTRLLAPAAPRKYLGVALNYADHIA